MKNTEYEESKFEKIYNKIGYLTIKAFVVSWVIIAAYMTIREFIGVEKFDSVVNGKFVYVFASPMILTMVTILILVIINLVIYVATGKYVGRFLGRNDWSVTRKKNGSKIKKTRNQTYGREEIAKNNRDNQKVVKKKISLLEIAFRLSTCIFLVAVFLAVAVVAIPGLVEKIPFYKMMIGLVKTGMWVNVVIQVLLLIATVTSIVIGVTTFIKKKIQFGKDDYYKTVAKESRKCKSENEENLNGK